MSVAILLPHGSGIRLAKEFIISYVQRSYPDEVIHLFVPAGLVENIQSYASSINLNLVAYDQSALLSHQSLVKKILRRSRMYIYDKRRHTNNTLDDFWAIETSQRLIQGKFLSKITFIIEFLVVQSSLYSKFLRHLFCRIERSFTDSNYFSLLFNEYSISRIIVTSISGVEDCEYAMCSASHQSLNTICLLQSWDNPSGNGFRLVEPDLYLSYGNLISRSINMYQDIPFNKITEVGAIQYQSFLDSNPQLKLDTITSKSPLKILYAGKSSNRFPFNYIFCEDIVDILNELDIDYHFTIRPHPISLVGYSLDRQPQARIDLQRMIDLKDSHPDNIFLDLPFSTNKFQATFDDNNSYRKIIEKIASYDLVVNVFGSIALEACIAKTYCISVNYEAREYKYSAQKTRRNLFIDERQTHNQLLRRAIPIANSRTELKSLFIEIMGNQMQYLDHEMDLVRQDILGL